MGSRDGMIRPTLESDRNALMDLAVASGRFELEQIGLLEEMLKSPGEEDVWFTDDDGTGPVGVAYLAPEKMTSGTWNLYWIAVHPERQRQGRGQTLLSYVQQWLSDRGARLLLVETAGTDDFDYVRKFYLDSGFEKEARIRDFYDIGVDKIVFRKAIACNASQTVRFAIARRQEAIANHRSRGRSCCSSHTRARPVPQPTSRRESATLFLKLGRVPRFYLHREDSRTARRFGCSILPFFLTFFGDRLASSTTLLR